MTMTADEARAVKRAPIVAGNSYTFYCEVQQEYEPPEKRLRRFSRQTVMVLREDHDRDAESSRMYFVRAADGTEFVAWEEELNGWDRDLGQFFNPDATYGPDRETWPLANERPAA